MHNKTLIPVIAILSIVCLGVTAAYAGDPYYVNNRYELELNGIYELHPIFPPYKNPCVICTQPAPQPELFVEELPQETPDIAIPEATSIDWEMIGNYTVTPPVRDDSNILYGIKYTVNMSVDNVGTNMEVLFRARLDLPDGRTFYTNWVGHNDTTPAEIIHQERISDIRQDQRWATGYHDHGLIVDQPHYNVTIEALGSATTAIVHDSNVEVFYLAELSNVVTY